MFPSFSGSSRRPRQVNLSGRRSTTQSKPQISGLSHQQPQHSDALLVAQQQRAKREAERRELEAAQRIQSTWRGRKEVAQLRDQWRDTWDQKYRVKLNHGGSINLQDLLSSLSLFMVFFDRTWGPGKSSPRDGVSGPNEDLERLRVLVEALTEADGSIGLRSLTLDARLQAHELSLLCRFMSALLFTITQLSPSSVRSSSMILLILQLIAQLPALALLVIMRSVRSISGKQASTLTYYRALSHITIKYRPSGDAKLQAVLSQCLLAPFETTVPESFSSPPASSIVVYTAFLKEYLSTPGLQTLLGEQCFQNIATTLDIGLLSTAAVGNNRDFDQQISSDSKRPNLKHGGVRDNSYSSYQQQEDPWILAYLIYFYRTRYNKNSFTGSFNAESYIVCLTHLLGKCAYDIRRRFAIEDVEMEGSSSKSPVGGNDDADDEDGLSDSDNQEGVRRRVPLPAFIREQLLTLVEQSFVTSLFSNFTNHVSKNGLTTNSLPSTNTSFTAQLIASYALTLILVFPLRASELRMWLYLSSTSDGTPAVRFLWDAVKHTSLFVKVSEDARYAVSSLREKRIDRNQTSGLSGMDQVSSGSRTDNDDWGVVLLFLELYSFLLIVMDDDEFFNVGKDSQTTSRSSSGEGTRTRESALLLSEIKDLTVFLNNLAFTLYWSSDSILGLQTQTQIAENGGNLQFKIAGINGIGLSFIKGVVTNMLRMIYMRDSRRRFLPKGHWLASRLDMEGFIPAVVAEEENRHEQEVEDEDEDADYEGLGSHRNLTTRTRLQKQQQRSRYLAALTPRLEILQHLPFFIPFETRVEIFREFVLADQRRRRGGNTDPDAWRQMIFRRQSHGRDRDPERTLSKHHATIRRDMVFEDAYKEFYKLGEGFKEPIQITFVDQFNNPEAGIDGGGVTKEFLTSVTKEAFSSERHNLFLGNNRHMLYPNPNSIEELRQTLLQEGESSFEIDQQIIEMLRFYEFLGRVIGKCLYEGILVDINFSGPFLLQWSCAKDGVNGVGNGYKPGVNDLRDLDEELYQGLVTLKNYTGDVETDFVLNFTATSSLTLGNGQKKTITVDLKPNGSNIPVTNTNRLEYIHLISRYRLLVQPRQQINAFLHGLGTMIKPSWLSMFNQSELQTLVGGGDSLIDVKDLRRNTEYGGLYVIGDDGQEHPVVQNFWKVLEEDFSDEDRRKVLKFVTSVSRAPLLGFGILNPRFSIRDGGDDQERLPSASTCVNLLKLPRYKTREILREKLLYAVNAGAGFDLS